MTETDTITLAASPVSAPASVAHPSLAGRRTPDRHAASVHQVQITTLVLWLACLGVGVLGFVLPYARPQAPIPSPEPVVVEKIEVALVPDLPAPLNAAAVSPDTPPPPATLEPAAPAQPIAVAEPSAVAFALPIDGPTAVVDSVRAAHSRPVRPQPAAVGSGLPAPQTLVFGQGEGRQPAPEYPLSAMNQRQQGTVGVRFTVTSEGRVRNATVAAASPWPLLDESAVRTVRHRWRFPRGPVRVYDVSIRFALAP